MGMVQDDVDMDEAAPDDEITNLLLKHERTNKDKVVIPGADDSDSDNRSDDSDDEQPGDDDEAALLAATFAGTTFTRGIWLSLECFCRSLGLHFLADPWPVFRPSHHSDTS